MPTAAPRGALIALLLRGLLAAQLLAGAVGHVLPLGRIAVRLGEAGAGVLRRAAVVLAGLGDAVAFLAVRRLLGRLREAGRTDAEADEGRQGGVDGLLRFHGFS